MRACVRACVRVGGGGKNRIIGDWLGGGDGGGGGGGGGLTVVTSKKYIPRFLTPPYTHAPWGCLLFGNVLTVLVK